MALGTGSPVPGGGGGLLVGSVFARVGAIFDPAGWDEQKKAAAAAQAQADKPIELKASLQYDPAGEAALKASLDSARAQEDVSAKAGLTFDPAGATKFQAALDSARAEADKGVMGKAGLTFDSAGADQFKASLDAARAQADTAIVAKGGLEYDPAGADKFKADVATTRAEAAKPIVGKAAIVSDGKGFNNYSSGTSRARADTKSFEKDLDGLIGKFSGLGFGLSKFAGGVGGMLTAFGAFEVVKQGISRIAEMNKTTAITEARLRSTGEAAHVTAAHIDELAMSEFKKTGVDHEQIVQGENMLLTYTRVRNELGLHRMLFDQVTKAALDLSVGTGKDLTTSMRMLGVAMQNPATGLTRLSRAGIIFSAEQKQQIKDMEASGNIYGAQQLILKQLEIRYGGTADAVGKTMPAALAKAKVAFKDMSAELTTRLAPTISAAANWFSGLANGIQHNTGVGGELRSMFASVGDAISTCIGWIKAIAGEFTGASKEADTLRGVLVAVVAGFAAFQVFKTVKGIIEGVTVAWSLLSKAFLASPIGLVLAGVALIAVAVQAAGIKWTNFAGFVSSAWKLIKTDVGVAVGVITGFLNQHRADLNAIGAAVSGLATKFMNVVTAIGHFGATSGILNALGAAIGILAGAAIKAVAILAKLADSRAGMALLGGVLGGVTVVLTRMIAAFVVAKIQAFLEVIVQLPRILGELRVALATSLGGWGLLLAAVGLVAGAMGIFGSSQGRAIATTRQLTDAIHAQKDAMDALKGVATGLKSAQLQLDQANLDVTTTEKTLNADRKNHHTTQETLRQDSINYQSALNQQKIASQGVDTAQKDATKTIGAAKSSTDDLISKTKGRISADKQMLQVLHLTDGSQQDLNKTTRDLAKQIATLKSAGATGAAGLAGVEASAQNMMNSNDAATRQIGNELNKALQSVGVKPVAFTPAGANPQTVGQAGGATVAKLLAGAGIGGQQHGGMLGYKGQRAPDSELVMAAPGEAFLTGDDQPYVDRALQLAHHLDPDNSPFRSLDHMFAGSRASHFSQGGALAAALAGFAKGGNVWNVRASAELASSGVGWTELSTNGNAAAVSGHPRTATGSGGWDFATLGRTYPHGTMLRIASGSHSGTFPLTDVGDGSSFAPAIGLTPAVQGALGGMPATVDISMADGSDISLASGFGRLVSGKGVFASGTGGGAAGASWTPIKSPKIGGPAGAYKSVIQGVADKLTKGANKYGQAHMPAPAASAGSGGAFSFQKFKGPLPVPVQKAMQVATSIVAKHLPYGTGEFGAYYGIGAPSYDCSGLVSTVLNAAGLDSAGHLLTGGLKSWGLPGDGKYITVGVLGADSGPTGHTMMEIANRYFESGGGGGGPHEDQGWSSTFPVHRHPPGLAQGGRTGSKHKADPSKIGNPGHQPTMEEFRRLKLTEARGYAQGGRHGWPQTAAGWNAHHGYSRWVDWTMKHDKSAGHPGVDMGSGEFYNNLYGWFRTNDSSKIPDEAWRNWHDRWSSGDYSYAQGGMVSQIHRHAAVPGAGQDMAANLRGLPTPGGLTPPAVKRAKAAMQHIWGRPYGHEGGHAPAGWNAKNYDCSGSVGYVLHEAGLNNAYQWTGSLASYGDPGDGRYITIGLRHPQQLEGHTMMNVDGTYFESGGGDGHGGAGGPLGKPWVHYDSGWDGIFPIRRHPRGLARGGLVKGYDATGDTLHQIPHDAEMVASYIDNYGGYQKAKGMFPHLPVLGIGVTPGNDNVVTDVFDIEPGGKTVPETIPWIERMVKMGRKPGAYGGRKSEPKYNLPDLVSGLGRRGVSRDKYLLWLADWNQSPTIPAGYDAHQYRASGPFDWNVFSNAWFGGGASSSATGAAATGKAGAGLYFGPNLTTKDDKALAHRVSEGTSGSGWANVSHTFAKGGSKPKTGRHAPSGGHSALPKRHASDSLISSLLGGNKTDKRIAKDLKAFNAEDAAVQDLNASYDRLQRQQAADDRQYGSSNVPNAIADSQANALIDIKKQITAKLNTELAAAKRLGDFVGGWLPDRTAKAAADTQIGVDDAARLTVLQRELVLMQRGQTASRTRASEAAKLKSLSDRLSKLRSTQGTVKGGGKAKAPKAAPRYDPYGNKLPPLPTTPSGGTIVDNTVAINQTQSELAAAQNAANTKLNNAADVNKLKDQISALKTKIKTDTRETKDVGKEVTMLQSIQTLLGTTLDPVTGIAGTIADVGIDIQTLTPIDPAAQPTDWTVLPTDEQSALDLIDYNIAVAQGLPVAQQSAAEAPLYQQVVDFWTKRKGELAAGGAPITALTSVQNSLNSAQQQLAGLTTTGATAGQTPDQAALAAQQATQISNLTQLNLGAEASIGALTSTGDIGQGGYRNAAGAAGSSSAYGQAGAYGTLGAFPSSPFGSPTSGAGGSPGGRAMASFAGIPGGIPPGSPVVVQHFSSLHPADPNVKAQIAAATVDALSGQSYRPATRATVL